MKILMCNSFYYLRGGAERYFLDLSDLLSSSGHEVVLFCMAHSRNLPSEYSSYFVSNIDYPSLMSQEIVLTAKLKIMGRVVYSQEAKEQIKRLIRATRPDIAHVHGIAHEVSPSILDAIKDFDIPIVQTLHDYKLLCPDTSFFSRGQVCEKCKGGHYFNVVRRRCKRDSLSASLLAALEMYIHHPITHIYEKNVDMFIAPSKFLQHKLAEYGFCDRVVNLPLFIDLKGFTPCYEPSDYFVYFGRLVSSKGVGTLIEAMRHVTSSHLYIVGEGDLESELREHAQRNGISNVTFLGYLNKEELVPIIQRAAFTVVPSEWYENYSMAILESFACGTAVIGSNLGGIPELITDGWNGLLFEAGNAGQLADRIQFLLRDRQKATEMGRNGRQQVEIVNNPQSHYQQIVDLYQSLLGGTPYSTAN